jgi:hypothetical protein
LRSAPFRLAAFGLLITIVRIAMFVAIIDSGFGPALGKIFAGAFAVFIAGGVYVSSFFVRPPRTRKAGAAGLIVFGVADLWFNEATVVFYTSSASLVGPDSNFLGISAESIRYFMQITALGFGVLPTLGAAVLGWMQAGALEVTSLNKPGIWARMGTALGKIVVGWGVAVAIRLESEAKQVGNNGQDVAVFPDDWRKLTASQKKQLERMSDREIAAAANITLRSAQNWLRDLAEEKTVVK